MSARSRAIRDREAGIADTRAELERLGDEPTERRRELLQALAALVAEGERAAARTPSGQDDRMRFRARGVGDPQHTGSAGQQHLRLVPTPPEPSETCAVISTESPPADVTTLQPPSARRRNLPSVRVWSDVAHLATMYEGSQPQVEHLTAMLGTDVQLPATDDEIRACLERLAAAARAIRRLAAAVTARAEAIEPMRDGRP